MALGVDSLVRAREIHSRPCCGIWSLSDAAEHRRISRGLVVACSPFSLNYCSATCDRMDMQCNYSSIGVLVDGQLFCQTLAWILSSLIVRQLRLPAVLVA